MRTQYHNLFKPNKSHAPNQIKILELPNLSPAIAPNFTPQAFKPLNLDYFQLKQKFSKSSRHVSSIQSHQIHTKAEEGSFQLGKVDGNEALLKDNQNLRKELQSIGKLYQEEKQKYIELKNLYKQGEIMYQALEEKRFLFERENKQLKQILENLYKELHLQNDHLGNLKFTQNKLAQKKVQKVKIGNKKIPIIKVNVPPQIFTKKQHSGSIFSMHSEEQNFESLKSQTDNLKKQVLKLTEANNHLLNQLNEVKKKLQLSQLTISSFYQRQFMPSGDMSFQTNGGSGSFVKQNLSTLTINNRRSDPFQTNLSISPKISVYQDSQNSVNYYKSKYQILETQLKKKDESLKNLYNQCYSLQEQINKLKSGFEKFDKIEHSDENSKVLTKSFPKQPEKMNEFYKDKINELQSKVNELSQMCIANVNNSLKIHQLNDTISKITRQNSICQDKLYNQQAEINRLYRILQNKNSELSQIYTSITQSKRANLSDVTKKELIDNSIFNNSTPEKTIVEDLSARKDIYFQKLYPHDHPTR